MTTEKPKMRLPGNGDELPRYCAEQAFAFFERRKAAKVPGYKPMLFARIPEAGKEMWTEVCRGLAEIVAVAIITDQRDVIGAYDGLMGGAYERAILKYAAEELNFNMTDNNLTEG